MMNNIIQVMTILVHCSYIMQLLDNIPFASSKPCWEKHWNNWNFQHFGEFFPRLTFKV